MKIFVLGVPHTQTTTEFTTCPFTIKAWNQCRMLHSRGHEVVHLGVEGSNPVCSENVAVIPECEWRALYGNPGAKQYVTRTDGKFRPYHERYARNVRQAILQRTTRPWEAVVCATWGGSQQAATRNLPQFVVESGIGYRHTWAKYRVFISYAWMHFHWGLENRTEGDRWYDVVIPNAVDVEMFDFRPQDKQDYFLFMGRLNDDKGVRVAIDVARRAGRPIKIVGQGDPARFLEGNPHATYLPPVGVEGRRKLMAEAAALLCPTQYVEPLGNVALEAQASGTPVIATDWGGFTESVLHGATGFRCRTMDQFVWAAKHVGEIDPAACRNWIVENFAPDRVGAMFEEYFQMLLDLDRDGWYAARPDRGQLDWLRRRYPAAAELERPPDEDGATLPDVVQRPAAAASFVAQAAGLDADRLAACATGRPKIFGIGLTRTGTTSLCDALNRLGYQVVHYPRRWSTVQQLWRGDYQLDILQENDGIVDGIAPFFRQFDDLYPGSRFILTVRDLDEWLSSVERWWRYYQVDQMKDIRFFLRTAYYGCVGFHADRYKFVYQRHHQEVEEYFRDRPDDLLVMNIARGDGWDKLCAFLDKPALDEPFPHSNRALAVDPHSTG